LLQCVTVLKRRLLCVRRHYAGIPRYVVIQVGISNSSGLEGGLLEELAVSRRIISAIPDHDTAPLRTHIDTFELTAPSGSRHTCLVYKPLSEPLTTWKQWFEDEKIHPGVVRAYVGLLLYALDRLHSECGLIHTGRLEAALRLLV
jgi:hypothetical protein